jgi:large subunit ribosomal protein L6
MSRIGKQPVTLPTGATLEHNGRTITVTGPKGVLTVPLVTGVEIEAQQTVAIVSRVDDTVRAPQGLVRSLLQNAVTGVTKGWTKELELNGVGMRAVLSGSTLTLNLGFSHPVVFTAPQGINFAVNRNVITVSGIDKQLVGETSAKIREFKKPEPYKGKGIRYTTEIVRRKAGKTGKAGK